MKRISLSAVIAVTLSLLLCGCENNAEQTGEKDILDVFSQLDDYGEPSEYPVYINGTEINAAPRKVVCLSQSLSDIVSEMGHGETIVGIGSYCVSPAGASFPADIGKPTQPDIEKIISLSPDILFTSTSIPNKDVMELAENGVATVYIQNPRSTEEFGRIYNAVGMIYGGMFDGEEAGKAAFAPISDAFESVSTNCGSFVYITEGLAAAGGWTLENSVLSVFGTSAAEKAGITGYSPDTAFLSEEQPDYIFLNDAYTIEDLSADETLGALSAVAEGRVIPIDNSYFENPSKNITSLIKDITEKLSASATERGAE